MQHGHIDLGFDKVVMFGVARSGKTCSLHTLLGQRPPDQGSTPLMERPITVLVISRDDGEQWKKMTQKEVHKEIAHIIRSRPLASPSSEHTGDHMSEHTGQQQSSATANELNIPTEGGASNASNTPVISPGESEREGTSEAQSMSKIIQQILSDVEEEYVSLINTSTPSSEPIHKQDWVYLIDSGGQQEFHEVLPIFLNGASDFIYVFRLNDPLDRQPKNSYCDSSGEPVCEPHPSPLTNEDIFKRCMRTVHSFTLKNKDSSPPQILILGTHRDLVKEEELSQIQETVKRIVEETGVKNQVIFKGENYVFSINAKEPDSKDLECAKDCQKMLNQEHGKRRKEVPLRWYALEYMMQEASQKLNRNVLSRHECLEIAKSLHIDDESCKEALNFFCKLNRLFYWPDILPDLVFVEPKVILDKVSELVKECYKMKSAPSPRRGEWHDFRDYAKVSEKMLKDLKEHYVYEKQMFTPNNLITLFESLLVFAKLSKDSWFMPSLLKVIPENEVQKYRVSPEKALVVYFPDDRPLIGMFCCMVAFVLSPDDNNPCLWKVFDNKGKPKCLNRNVIMFTVQKYSGSVPAFVTMIDLYTHFEVHVETHQKKESELWLLVRRAVFTGLGKASEILGYTKNTPEAAIICPEHQFPPHYATIDNEGVWACSKEHNIYGDKELKKIPWWENSKKHNCHVGHVSWFLNLTLCVSSPSTEDISPQARVKGKGGACAAASKRKGKGREYIPLYLHWAEGKGRNV